MTSACGGTAAIRVEAVGGADASTTSTATSTTTSTTPQPDLLPDMKVITPAVPRGGVLRVEGKTCGDAISVSVGASFAGAGDGVVRGRYMVSGDLPSHPFTLGVSVPTTVAPGDYPVVIECWSGDAGFPWVVRSVTVTSDEVAPVATTVSAPANGHEGEAVRLVGSGCHSGGLTASKARVLVETTAGFGGTWDEYFADIGADGDFVVDAVLQRLVDTEHFPKWFVTSYCVSPAGMNYGEASTAIELAPPAPSTTVPIDPLASSTTAPELPHTN